MIPTGNPMRNNSYETSTAVIVNVDTEFPEKRLAGAVINRAIRDAVHHEREAVRNEAYEWFDSTLCFGWLALICPPDVTIENVQQMALSLIVEGRREWRQRKMTGL